jgi:hypothetical protein
VTRSRTPLHFHNDTSISLIQHNINKTGLITRPITSVLKLSRRQNSMKFFRADRRVRRHIKSDVSKTDSVSIIRAVTWLRVTFSPFYILTDDLARYCERANRRRWAEFENSCNLIGCQMQFAVVSVWVAHVWLSMKPPCLFKFLEYSCISMACLTRRSMYQSVCFIEFHTVPLFHDMPCHRWFIWLPKVSLRNVRFSTPPDADVCPRKFH